MNSLEKEDDLDRALSGQSKTERLIGSVAAMICSNAFELRLSHTIDGEWPDNELGVKAEHDAMLELVGELGRLKRSCSEIPNDWTGKLNSCRFHDDDRAACATYSGQVPCDAGHSAGDNKMVGTPCGVLVRKDGRLAAVDEHGRVQWFGDEDKDGEYVAYLEGMNSHLKAELEAARAQGSVVDIDQVALDTVQAISEIDPDKLKGGKTQATARAQCYVIEAIEWCLPSQGDAALVQSPAMSRIAQRKIEQMGGTPCGLLVRNEAGALAAVSDMGRVTWLDDCVTQGDCKGECVLPGQGARAQGDAEKEAEKEESKGDFPLKEESLIRKAARAQGDAEPAKVTSEMKAECMGEFSWQEEAPYYDEDGEIHDYVATHVVPWDICKQIYKRMASCAPPKAQAVAGGWTPSSEGSTGWEFRFVEALKLLCGGSEPSDRLVKEWLNHESEDLQAWVASETALHWSMGITTIEAAMSLADEPVEGEDHCGERPQPPKAQAVPESIEAAIYMLEDYASALENGDLDGAGHSTTSCIHEVIDQLAAAPQPPQEGSGDEH